MSKKNKTTDEQPQQPSVVALLAASQDVSDRAAVVQGLMFHSAQTPPVVFVQSDTRVVAVGTDDDAARELCEAVVGTLSADYQTTVAGAYGTAEATGKVWYDITITPKKK